ELREFRGFSRVTIESSGSANEEPLTRTIRFHQGNYSAGRPGPEDGAPGHLVGRPYHEEIADGAGRLLRETTYTYGHRQDQDSPWYFDAVEIATTRVCERTANCRTV